MLAKLSLSICVFFLIFKLYFHSRSSCVDITTMIIHAFTNSNHVDSITCLKELAIFSLKKQGIRDTYTNVFSNFRVFQSSYWYISIELRMVIVKI